MSIPVTENESLTPGPIIDLFKLDLNPVGIDTVFYFQQADAKGGSLWYGGNEYVPRPIQVEGFSKSSTEGPPEPTLTIGNVDKFGYQLLNDFNDLLGAQITRIRTYAMFLDFLEDGVTVNPDADSSAMQIPEIWYVEQKDEATRLSIKFKLRSIMDLRSKRFPARLLLKKVCTRNYRVWNGSSFTYPITNACPYAGSNYFTRAGVPTTAANDACGKDPGSCGKRFSTDLPGWFFPGVRRVPRNAA